MVEDRARRRRTRRAGLRHFVTVPRVRARLIVAEHGPRRLELVKDLRHRHHEAVPREHRRHPPDRPSALEKSPRTGPRRRVDPAPSDDRRSVHPSGPSGRSPTRGLFEDHGAQPTPGSRAAASGRSGADVPTALHDEPEIDGVGDAPGDLLHRCGHPCRSGCRAPPPASAERGGQRVAERPKRSGT